VNVTVVGVVSHSGMARTRCQTQVSSCAAAASSAPSARLGASRFSLLSSGTGLFMKSSGFTPRRPMLAPSSGVAGVAGAAGAARGSARGAGACHGRGGEGHGAPPRPVGQSSTGYWNASFFYRDQQWGRVG